LLPLLAAVAFTTGCGRREAPADVAAREGRFLMVTGADPQTLDPHVATGFPEFQVLSALFEGLTVLDPVTCMPRPGAAEKWDVSADGTVYTFHLRQNTRHSLVERRPRHGGGFRLQHAPDAHSGARR
jgi:oligopeptide transport system substrate-binding protein